MRTNVTDDSYGQDAHPHREAAHRTASYRSSDLSALVHDAMRRMDAARNVDTGETERSRTTPTSLGAACTPRSLRWSGVPSHGADLADLHADSALGRIGRHVQDIAAVAAAVHRSRVASVLHRASLEDSQ